MRSQHVSRVARSYMETATRAIMQNPVARCIRVFENAKIHLFSRYIAKALSD